MANDCYFEMRVAGKKENIDRLISILKYKDNDYQLARIFSADVFEQTENTTAICGDCAWSVHSCMTKDGYAKSNSELTTMQELSKILSLKIEILSDEPGMGFCEHYYYDSGKCIIDKCIDYPDFENYDDDFEEFCAFDELNIDYEYL